MRQAALHQRPSVLSLEQARVRAGMIKLGIDMDEACWVWPVQATYTARRRLDWATFLRPLAGALRVNPQLASTLQWLAACWLTGCGGEFLPVHPSTVHNRLLSVRRVLRVVLESECLLETVTPRQAQDAFRRLYFDESELSTSKRTSLRHVLYATHDLFRLRAYLPVSFAIDPFPPAFVQQVLARAGRSDPWTAPPEPVCLELIRQAIRLIGKPADDIIRLREKYIIASESLKRRKDRKRVRVAATRSLKGERFATLDGEEGSWTDLSAEQPRAIKHLAAALEGACATVLLFLSGPRVSEIQLAGPGCLRYLRHSNGISYPYYFAHRSKQRASSAETGVRYRLDAQNRGWILGPAGVRALEVLEKLSRRARAASKSTSYWASVVCSGLWSVSSRTRFSVATPSRLNIRLNDFARLVGLAERTGWHGRLHSHMGRKACARFIAKRDRTALADLALQFGHLSAYVTDVGYARPDAEYRRLIDEELAAEMYEVAADLAALDVERTFSNLADPAVVALRDRAADFVGQMRSTVDVRRMLGQGVRLVPCDWGMCVYREETSACGGNEFGPNAERRSPVVCRTCINFLATEKHRPFWQRRVEDCRTVLQHRGLPEQTVKLVQLRLSEALQVLASISAAKGSHELGR